MQITFHQVILISSSMKPINMEKLLKQESMGDWSQERLKNWKSQAEKYSLTYVQQYANLSNKGNVTDFSLVIDAMDILYSNKVNAFCIVSSDSDFTKLIIRLKEDNMYLVEWVNLKPLRF